MGAGCTGKVIFYFSWASIGRFVSRRILIFLNSRLRTMAVHRTAYTASAVSLICQVVSSCMSSGQHIGSVGSYQQNRSCTLPLALALQALLKLAPQTRQKKYRSCTLPLALAHTAGVGATSTADTGAMHSTTGATAAIPAGAGAVSSLLAHVPRSLQEQVR